VTFDASTRQVRVRAPGKVNLSLAVGALAPDGYHPLATVFQAVSLYEDLTARPSDTFELTVAGPFAEGVPTDETNLALRAARLLAEHAGIDEGVRLHVHKGVPVAGGMAGGSADAAAALLACDALWQTRSAARRSPSWPPSWAPTCRSLSSVTPPSAPAAVICSRPR